MKRASLPLIWTFLFTCLLAAPADATPPWLRVLSFSRVDADPDGDYTLKEEHGPWMILAANFAGEMGEKQAKELVLELRREYGLKAYSYRQEFDYSGAQEGLGFDRYGNPEKFRHMYDSRYEGIAVLVGDFDSLESSNMEDTLEKLKHMRPDCLELKEGEASGQRMAVWRALQRQLSRDPEKKKKGPMGAAFVTRNPLLPDEYFRPQGLDPLVEQMNKGVEHSLLANPGRYTIRVATYRGTTITGDKEIQRQLADGNSRSQLEEAALKANKLCLALRKRGVEAYEFHDRYESIVTVGSFNSLGTQGPEGQLELSPSVHRLMEQFSAEKRPIAGHVAGVVPRQVDGIPLDIQAVPVEVPKKPLLQR